MRRPGSGKSTIIAALRGLVPLAAGTIWIDDVDLATVSLRESRPPVHVLFEGMFRENLAPSRRSNDSDMLGAFAGPAHLAGGTKLSAGQTQLVALARAVLARVRILVLDETTANADQSTDEIIQQVLQQSFRDSTVLCMAHRATGVAWMDCVITMGDGQSGVVSLDDYSID